MDADYQFLKVANCDIQDGSHQVAGFFENMRQKETLQKSQDFD